MVGARGHRGTAAGGERRVGAMPLTVSTTGTLDGGEGPENAAFTSSIGPFAHGDTPDARSGQGCRSPTDGVAIRRQAVIRPTNSPEDPVCVPSTS